MPILGEECWVNWNGEDYSAKVLAMGDQCTAKKTEADILKRLEDHALVSGEEEDNSPPSKSGGLVLERK